MSERKGTRGLELWCKRLVKDCPNVQIDNMTTSWRNGIAFCALVHHFRPDLIDVTALKPENIYENNQLAFSIAEKELGIPALLDPIDMVENEVPDRLSILTYLSQFYRHLGHTVKNKVSENKEPQQSASSTVPQNHTPIQFGKTGLDKCAACSLPVYLAQRLIVSHKLYHRRCFRCTKCSGHLNQNNFQIFSSSDFLCDSCKNENLVTKYLHNNNDQMGMLAFSDDATKPNEVVDLKPNNLLTQQLKSQSILDKISIFEQSIANNTKIEDKLYNLSLKETANDKPKESNNKNKLVEQFDGHESLETCADMPLTDESKILNEDIKIVVPQKMPDVISYKSNLEKLNFLQTQLAEDVETGSAFDDVKVFVTVTDIKEEKTPVVDSKNENTNTDVNGTVDSTVNIKKDVNFIGDDSQILNNSLLSKFDSEINPVTKEEQEPVARSVPPRRKKHNSSKKKESVPEQKKICPKINIQEYPDHLNPFSEDEDEELSKDEPKKASTNPFGSSDEEDDSVPPIPSAPKPVENTTTCRSKDQISTCNPFWSDGEPSSDEESHNESSNMYKCSMTTSTPNLPGSTPRRKKPRAPPPPVLGVTGAAPPPREPLAASMDDVASISSVSSFNSTAHSDYKSLGKSTPMLKGRRPAPTPPDSLSTVSIAGSLEKGMDASENRHNTSDGGARRPKGPAPGLPLPERREVKMQMSPEELQVQLDMLETQQLGLERQGVLIEQMIRQKCEGDEVNTVPQEEVEDLVIQLCEIVNEKNDLFRKQTELMYIRRQQRLEQEQADIEHEIRILQSRPVVNRIDADKVREEQLVSRLVEIVRMRDELVQQLDSERRRERQEDLAIAASIASKRAQRNSDSTSSSMKSMEVQSTPKKNKMKDKVKKQLKKAKHTLIPKKKDDSTEQKEEKTEKKK